MCLTDKPTAGTMSQPDQYPHGKPRNQQEPSPPANQVDVLTEMKALLRLIFELLFHTYRPNGLAKLYETENQTLFLCAFSSGSKKSWPF
jgi:hypothetical protein